MLVESATLPAQEREQLEKAYLDWQSVSMHPFCLHWPIYGDRLPLLPAHAACSATGASALACQASRQGSMHTACYKCTLLLRRRGSRRQMKLLLPPAGPGHGEGQAQHWGHPGAAAHPRAARRAAGAQAAASRRAPISLPRGAWMPSVGTCRCWIAGTVEAWVTSCLGAAAAIRFAACWWRAAAACDSQCCRGLYDPDPQCLIIQSCAPMSC
jgi:hypothetical protein